jgi:tyrosine-protein kinase Etk/Wzc
MARLLKCCHAGCNIVFHHLSGSEEMSPDQKVQAEGKMGDKEISILDYLQVIVKWRKLIVWSTIGLGVFAFLVSLAMPNRYVAKAVLLPPEETQDVLTMGYGLSDLLGGGGGKLGGLGGFTRNLGLPGTATLSDMFGVILKSRTVGEGVIESQGLIHYYKLDRPGPFSYLTSWLKGPGGDPELNQRKVIDSAFKSLSAATKVDISPEGMITVAVEDKSPRKASEIANAFVAGLDRFNKEINVTQAKNTRLFIEGRLAETKKSVDQAENDLREFEEKNKIVSLSDETKAAIEGVAKLKAEIISREVQLGVLHGYATDENPQVVQLKSEIASFRNQMKTIEEGKAGVSSANLGYGAGFSVPFSKLPAVGMELARLMREVKMQETLLSLLIEQYERAKINEARDTPTVRVLDQAVPPVKKSRPKRILFTIGGCIVGFFLTLGIVGVMEYYLKLREKPQFLLFWKTIPNNLKDLI